MKIPMIPSTERPTCLGSGLVVLDVILRANSTKPEFFAGGSCCNVLTILAYLGWRSFPIARLGCDIEGNRIVEDMRMWGVRDRFIEKDHEMHSPRIIHKIYAGNNPKHSFSLKCFHGRWLPRQKSFRLDSLKRIESKLPSADIFYFDRATPSSLKLALRQKEMGALIVFEPPKLLHNKNFKACLEISDVLKHCYDSELEDWQYTRPPIEIQTRGKMGLRYRANMLSQTKWTALPAFNVNKLTDAAGSGDWLTAGLIHALRYNGRKGRITNKNLQDALLFGQCLAALNCHYSGARGLMYNILPNQLRALVSTVMVGRSPKQTLEESPAFQYKTDLSSKCKVCLCR